MDDRHLISRVQAGDASAERELYDTHVERVYRLVYRLAGDADQAQDYTQETFIRAFGRLGEFRGEAALGTWICSIAVSVALNGLRRGKRLRTREVALDEAATTATPDRAAEPDLRDRLARAIDALPEGYRVVFLMHDVEGYTHEEIGTSLGKTASFSKSQLSRAYVRLRGLLTHGAEGASCT